MSGLKDWLLGITAASLAVALAQALTPEGAVKRAGRLVGGLVLVLAMLRPLAQADLTGALWEGWDLPALTEERAEEAGEEVLAALIAQKAGAYIVDKGEALGCTCTAEVTVAPDGSGWPVPWSVRIEGRWTGEGRRALEGAVEEELGIPAARQTFVEEGT